MDYVRNYEKYTKQLTSLYIFSFFLCDGVGARLRTRAYIIMTPAAHNDPKGLIANKIQDLAYATLLEKSWDRIVSANSKEWASA